MTKTVALCELTSNEHGEIAGAMHDIAFAFDTRICSEDATFRNGTAMTFTNATLEHAFGTIMSNTTGYAWRYDGGTDSVYVHPATNAISMTRRGPISIANATISELLNEHDIFGLGISDGIAVSPTFLPIHTGPDYLSQKISLELGESYVWEILDAICVKAKGVNCWQINEIPPGSRRRYEIVFHQINTPFPPPKN
ncbi:MAG: hypothetical protein FWG05_06300 [Kiritimatiellaeota bacterium]|nr:hypothetical protein [Kiritimatiellota bacterium]